MVFKEEVTTCEICGHSLKDHFLTLDNTLACLICSLDSKYTSQGYVYDIKLAKRKRELRELNETKR